jgi:hypothetical protein
MSFESMPTFKKERSSFAESSAWPRIRQESAEIIFQKLIDEKIIKVSDESDRFRKQHEVEEALTQWQTEHLADFESFTNSWTDTIANAPQQDLETQEKKLAQGFVGREEIMETMRKKFAKEQ